MKINEVREINTQDLKKEFSEGEKILLSEINSRDDIYSYIKTFLGKGK